MTTPTAWPRAVFDAPPLRDLDARGQRELERAGRLVELTHGETLYRAGESADVFFVVAKGSLKLSGAVRGEVQMSSLRRIEIGECLGEEAVVGASRPAAATADGPSVVAEIPAKLFDRVAGRASSELAQRMRRSLERQAGRDIVATSALGRLLSPAHQDELLDAATVVAVPRGQAIYREGDRAHALYVVAQGLVQLQTEEGDRITVRGYVSRGDVLGGDELADARPRDVTAVASGAVVLLEVPARPLRHLLSASPDWIDALSRARPHHEDERRADVARNAAAHRTAHVFQDLYRFQIARSLLVIDLDTCVRCGHCAWACEQTHGVARLVRRGDKLVAQIDASVFDTAGPAPEAERGRPLLLPNSCQHCENPACMIDCPTGAIGKDPRGEVFIREPLCTGCEACAKACPWDNIQMAPRPGSAAPVAVKCDLCRALPTGPACVQACPVQAISRVHPADDFDEVRAFLGGPAPTAASPTRSTSQGAWAPRLIAAASVGVGLAGGSMHARGHWSAFTGVGYAAGVVATAMLLGLLVYGAIKRGVRVWTRIGKPSSGDKRVSSRTRPHRRAHVALGCAFAAATLFHSGVPDNLLSSGGALFGACWIAIASGVWMGATAKLLPRQITRLERRAALPEDYPDLRTERIDELYREVSGRSDLVKKLFEKVLLPYIQAPLGFLALLSSGRSLRQEEALVRADIDRALEGRGRERLAGLESLIRIAVELRGLRGARLMHHALAVGLPVHVVSTAIALVLLTVHVAMVVT